MLQGVLRARGLRGRLFATPLLGALQPVRLRGRLRAAEDTMLISPENYFQIIQGSSLALTLTVTDDKGKAFDLTGQRVIFTVKESPAARTPLLQKVSSVPEQILVSGRDARLGVATIFLVPADTASLRPGKYVFDVWALAVEGGARQVVIPPSEFEVVQGITVLP